MEERKSDGDLLTAMLRLAGKLEDGGRLHEACELYFKILDGSPGTESAETAREALFNVAYEYERKGLVRMALDLYERLA